MHIIILLLYITVLAVALTYAIGGVGLGLAIVFGLGTIVALELLQAKHDENERSKPGAGHHHPAHGGLH